MNGWSRQRAGWAAKAIALLSLMVLNGCSTTYIPEPVQPDAPEYAPPALEFSLPTPAHGSLYRKGYNLALYQDRRAYRVGDILTVDLEEKTQASKKADTSTSKDSSLQGSGSYGFGSSTGSGQAQLGGGRDFSGNGSSSQQNQLTGAITVTVSGVLPNGVLVIRGEKWLRLNQGDEYIRLVGLVRPEDVDQANRISSQRIADARISYGGRGTLADVNAPGWGMRFFNDPIFPF
ncbi:flagellar basal body L-ring protein FlgH [Ferrimonas balearica]|uniref:flagellar basal body L-ring protein FlgH n=1 Tax=Ferrimonas balearica TaxID=44012 RepID=UPI001F3D369B|nr:flagellar basal body L-ring protein FlgH [Ferrimonas balearica]MBY6016988.1 flagellar basal body L-ring protein FlgH [Halomonas denitrificans]MBY6093263.1 flagellar basal body L-ring protein FlgH [Ferrimonas balearica]